jgi:hypothetical protein
MKNVLPILFMVSLHVGHIATLRFLSIVASLVIFLLPKRVQLLNVAAGLSARANCTRQSACRGHGVLMTCVELLTRLAEVPTFPPPSGDSARVGAAPALQCNLLRQVENIHPVAHFCPRPAVSTAIDVPGAMAKSATCCSTL